MKKINFVLASVGILLFAGIIVYLSFNNLSLSPAEEACCSSADNLCVAKQIEKNCLNKKSCEIVAEDLIECMKSGDCLKDFKEKDCLDYSVNNVAVTYLRDNPEDANSEIKRFRINFDLCQVCKE